MDNITRFMCHRGKTHQAPTPAGIPAPCPMEHPLTVICRGMLIGSQKQHSCVILALLWDQLGSPAGPWVRTVLGLPRWASAGLHVQAKAEHQSCLQLHMEGSCQRENKGARMLWEGMVMSHRGGSVKHHFTRRNVWVPESNHGVNSPYLHNLTYAHSGA